MINYTHFLNETKPGEKFDKDFPKLIQGKSLPINYKDNIIDLNKVVSPLLDNLFVVLELECFYPIEKTINQTVVADVSTPFNYPSFFEEDFNYESDVFKFRTGQVLEKLEKKTELYKTVSKTKTFQTLITLIKNISDLHSLHVAENALTKLLGTKAVRDSIFIPQWYVILENFYSSIFNGNKSPSISEVLNKYELKLKPKYKFNSDKTKIMEFTKKSKSQIESFKSIATDLKKRFMGSMFSNVPISILENPKSDSTQDKGRWYVTSDSSLDEIDGDERFEDYNAVELVSSAIPYRQLESAITFLSQLFKTVKIITNDNCSMHANIGFTTKRDIDPLKVIVLTNDIRELDIYNRGDSRFTKSQFDALRKNSKVNEQTLSEFSKSLKELKTIDFSKYLDSEKYRSINLAKWFSTKEGYEPVLEFRIIGGEGYLPTKVSESLNSLHRYCNIVAISGDPNLYQKEYLTKLAKIQELYKSYKVSMGHSVSGDISSLEGFLSNLKRLSLKTDLTSKDIEYFTTLISKLILKISFPIKFTDFAEKLSPILNKIYKNQQLLDALLKLKEENKDDITFMNKFNKIFYKLKNFIQA